MPALTVDLLPALAELLGETFSPPDFEVRLHEAVTTGSRLAGELDVRSLRSLSNVAYWATIVVADGRLQLRLARHDPIVSSDWENRTERLDFDLAEPNLLPWMVTTLRRHFCLEWGRTLCPWEK